jgi:hypothetical protein
MLTWFRRLFSTRPEVPRFTEAMPPPEPLPEPPPGWAYSLIEAIQRSSRVQARLSLQVEDVERKLEGGLSDLRGTLFSRQGAAPSPSEVEEEPRWGELLDAMDLLEEATRVADTAHAPGLAGVVARLEVFLVHAGLKRLAPLGELPDGRLFRIVGNQSHATLPEGSIARVIRAAVVRGEQLIREGEAITVRNYS